MPARRLALAASALALIGCGGTAPAVPAAPAEPRVDVSAFTSGSMCLLRGTELVMTETRYDGQAGRTYTAEGQFLSELGQPREYAPWVLAQGRYAAGQPWYVNNGPVTLGGATFEKVGLPRVLGVNEVVFAGYAGEVPAFREAGQTGDPTVIYVPVRPECEFQPYQRQR